MCNYIKYNCIIVTYIVISHLKYLSVIIYSPLSIYPRYTIYVGAYGVVARVYHNAFLFTPAYKPAFQLRNVSFSTMGREEQENEGTAYPYLHVGMRTCKRVCLTLTI